MRIKMKKKSKSVDVYVTSQGKNEKISKKRTIFFDSTDMDSENQLINIHENIEYQEIIGFGGAFTEAAAVTFYKLPLKTRKQILTSYFDNVNGIGYTIGRTHINSCDFACGNYAYVEDSKDVKLKSFSIARDEKALIPLIKEAQKVAPKPLRLFASPWSPPAWMKTNNQMNLGGKLKPNCHRIWAEYIAKYIKTYAAEGIKLWGITVQNEPKAKQTWDSCVYTAEEERDFVKKYLGPVLWKSGLKNIKVFVWDHNKERIFERGQTIFSDKKASQYIAGIGFHWYSGDHFESLDLLHSHYPDKMLLFTEGCNGTATFDKWDTGENYAHDIIGDLNHWTQGWTDWNLLLDEQGGPNHVGNFCNAPIIADTKTGKLRFQSSYYYIGHFSKFIVPGSRRIALSKFTDKLEVTSARRPDGKIVVVVLNRNDDDMAFKIRCKHGVASLTAAGHSIMTLVY